MAIALSVILVNWNAADYLRSCLHTLQRHVEGLSYELIVVDHSRWDGCAAMLQQEFPAARLLQPPGNLGFARGNNYGFAHARGRHILFLNPDTEIHEDALPRMVGWLDAHPQTGALGVRLCNSDGTLQESCVQAFPTLLNQMLDCRWLRRWLPHSRLWGTAGLLRPDRPTLRVDAVSGACLMVRREAFLAVGQFSACYFMYADDLDLCYKLRRAGYAVECMTSSEVLHHGGRSSSQRTAWFADVAQRTAMAQFLRATRGSAYATAYRGTTAVMACLRLLLGWATVPFATGGQREKLRSALRRWRQILCWSLGLPRAGQPS